MWWRFAAVSVALACAACASPSSKEAADFGKAASDTLAIISDARTAEVDLIREAGAEHRACDYLTQGKIDLRPPLDSKGSKLIQEQIALLKAITEYAKALAEATDPQGVSDLESAATNLSNASTSFLTPAISSSPLIGPAITLLSAVAVDVVELETRARLRAVIEATHRALVQTVIRIMIDAREADLLVEAAYTRWASEKSCNLSDLRSSYQVVGGNAPLYSLYKDTDATARAFRQRLAVLNRGKLAEALEALLKAHEALLANDIDFKLAYQKLKEVVADLQAINKAASPAPAAKPAASVDSTKSATDSTKG